MKNLNFTFIFLCLLPSFCIAQKQGQDRIDSLILVLPSMSEDSNKVKMLEEISFSSYSINPQQGLKYGFESLNLAKLIKWDKGIARAYNTIGINYGFGRADYPNALDNYLKSLTINERLGDQKEIAASLNNIGSLYDETGENQRALDYYNRALVINQKMGNKDWMANNLSNIGVLYTKLKEFNKAIQYKKEAMKLKEELGDQWGIATNTSQLARIYGEMGQLDTAIILFHKALDIFTKLGDQNSIAKNLDHLGTAHLYMAANKPQLRRELLDKALLYNDSALTIYMSIRHLQNISGSYISRSEIMHALGKDNEALEDYKVAMLYKDSVFNMEKDKKLVQQAMQYDFDRKEAINLAEQEKKDIRQKLIRYSMATGLSGAFIFSLIVWRQRNRISKEKARSEELLLNILPGEVAEELKIKGEAEAKLIDEVTVLFTDFKGFTALSEQVTPKELVNDLHECFSAFDAICEKHGIEKIKTIGDAYMAAGGLPTPNSTHAKDVILAALEMAQFIEEGKAQKIAAGLPYFEIRIGVHTGPVVAGIVGVKKFQYDIWGDTVNTASRMESSGEVGMVNISETTYQILKDDSTFVFEPRGKVQAKGKGEIDMYYVKKAIV
ncbi:MAG TPA: adenylate/guanylate cyclase domain-containing protein [Flavobacteriales bacterium]|nr:adenylate/guanylate cyclase domain-containing protein [Flavobacteriales bacterium]